MIPPHIAEEIIPMAVKLSQSINVRGGAGGQAVGRKERRVLLMHRCATKARDKARAWEKGGGVHPRLRRTEHFGEQKGSNAEGEQGPVGGEEAWYLGPGYPRSIGFGEEESFLWSKGRGE